MIATKGIAPQTISDVITPKPTSVFGVSAPNFLGSSGWAMPAIVLMSLWQGFGYNFLVFSTAIDQVPQEQLEAAAIDGASGLERFRHVTLPMITPSIFFATTLTLITSFQVFAQPFLLRYQRPNPDYYLMSIYAYEKSFGISEYGLGSAIALTMVVLLLGVTFFYIRQMIRIGEVR